MMCTLVEITKALDPVFSAQWDALGSSPGCLEGTRVDIIENMLSWCTKDTDRFSVYRLSGHAGTGKSAIARTLCTHLVSHSNMCVLTFFASRDAVDRRDPLRILHTFAWELARNDAFIRQGMLAVIRRHPDLKHRPIKEQVKLLLLDTIEIPPKSSVVMILDALDECAMTNGVEGGSLICDLAEILAGLPVKLVITSRMEESLRRMFASLPHHITQLLHEVESTSVISDVRLILMDGFAKIAAKHEISAFPWPVTKDIESLVERTGRFVIFATTVLKFVESDRYSPERRLKEILENTAIPTASPEFSQLDALYWSVLISASRSNSATTEVDPTLCSRLRNLIGAVVLVEQPLSIPALAQLMEVPGDEVDRDVWALSAVLLVGPEKDSDDALVVRALHLSFRDFLLSRCNDQRFRIQEFAQHHDLTVNCLTILNSTLKQDMCNILNPTVSNSALKDPPLTARLRKSIPSAARYAGQHWMVHNSQASAPSTVLLVAMRAFARQHLFHWIELLSLIAQVPYAIQHLPVATAWWMVSIHCHFCIRANDHN
jgi:hypothetical protein